MRWLRLRYNISKWKAVQVINEGWLYSESHPLKNRYVPTDLRGKIELRLPDGESLSQD